MPSSTPPPREEPRRAPPTVEECFNAAAGSSAAVYLSLRQHVDLLVDANLALDDVIMRGTATVDHLEEIREEALAQRRRNTAAIECLTQAIENAPHQ